MLINFSQSVEAASIEGSVSAGTPVVVPTEYLRALIALSVNTAAGDTISVSYTAAGATLPVSGLQGITAPSTVTLPARVSSLIFTTTAGTGVDNFEIRGN